VLLLLTSCRALEASFISADLRFTVALMPLCQLLPLKAMELEYALALERLPQPCLLRRRELPFFQGFQFPVPGHASRFALLTDGICLTIKMPAAPDERDPTTNQASTPRAKRIPRFSFNVIDPPDLLRMPRDGYSLVVPETLRLRTVQGPHLIGLASVFLQLLRFLIPLPLRHRRLGAPPHVRGGFTFSVRLGGVGLFPVLRLLTHKLLLRGRLHGLLALLRLFLESFAPLLVALLIVASPGFRNAALLRLDSLGLSLRISLRLFDFGALPFVRVTLQAIGTSLVGTLGVPCVPPLVVASHMPSPSHRAAARAADSLTSGFSLEGWDTSWSTREWWQRERGDRILGFRSCGADPLPSARNMFSRPHQRGM
jgi:hypothetical protein